MITISLFILFVSIITALTLYVMMPVRCSAKSIKESLVNSTDEPQQDTDEIKYETADYVNEEVKVDETGDYVNEEVNVDETGDYVNEDVKVDEPKYETKDYLDELKSVPYYKQPGFKPDPDKEYAYANGMYCEVDDMRCKAYSISCKIGEPNCHNYRNETLKDENCYNPNGEYICGKNSNDASDFTDDLHNAYGGKCDMINGQLICEGDTWGKSDEKFLKNTPLEDVVYKDLPNCEIVDNKLVCEEGDLTNTRNKYGYIDAYKDEYRDSTLDPSSYRRGDRDVYEEKYHDYTQDLSPWTTYGYSRYRNDWGITHNYDRKKSWSNFNYGKEENPIMNYPLVHSAWNRHLESPPPVDTKDYTPNSDTLNKIFQTLYVLVSRNDCSQGIYGCCPDNKTAKSDLQGSNCTTGSNFNDVKLTDEVKKYIDFSISKNADKLTPPQNTSISNVEVVTKKKKDDKKVTKTVNYQQLSLPPDFSLSSAPTNSIPQGTFDQNLPISSTTNILQALPETNVLPAQSSYTNTVFLAGPQGDIIGNSPEPSFECKKGKGNYKNNNLPMPILADFSSFGM